MLRHSGSSQRKWGEGGQVTTSTKVEYLRPSASGNLTLQKDDFPAKEVRDYEWMLKRVSGGGYGYRIPIDTGMEIMDDFPAKTID